MKARQPEGGDAHVLLPPPLSQPETPHLHLSFRVKAADFPGWSAETNTYIIGTQIIFPLKSRKSLVPECRFPPALVGWNLDQTLILKSVTADRLQSEHLSIAVFFQVRSENQSWPSRSALHTDVHSELWPSWTHGDTTEEEFDRITCTFPHQVRLHSLVGSGNVTFHKIIVKPHLKW